MKERILVYEFRMMMPDKPWLGYTIVEEKTICEHDLPPGMFDWLVETVKKMGFQYTVFKTTKTPVESNVGAVLK